MILRLNAGSPSNGNQVIVTLAQKSLAVALSSLMGLAAIPGEGGAAPQANPSSANQANSQEEYAVLGADELDALVAPIALYPDALLAQVIGAATFPDQVLEADGWLKQNSSLKDKALTNAVDQKDWDPAVKALTQFPTVLDDLAKNLAWTSALGETSAMQQPDLMAAVQRMRAKAYAAGKLKSGPEIKIVQESPQVIVIQPANPQIVYVPSYNPTVVYATPVVTPGYSSSTVATASVVSFGAGIAIGMAISSSSSCGWGWHSWNTSWGMNSISYCRSPYYGNPYWWGGYYPGYRGHYPYPPRPPYYRYPPGYRPPYAPAYRPPYNTPRPTPYSGTPGTRPSTRPFNPAPGTRPTRMPANPAAGTRPATRPTPSTNELRGYPRPSTPNAPTPSTRPSAFPSSTASRAQSARGNESIRSRPAPATRTAPARTAPRAAGPSRK